MVDTITINLRLDLFDRVLYFQYKDLLQTKRANARPRVTPRVITRTGLLLDLTRPFQQMRETARTTFSMNSILHNVLLRNSINPTLIRHRPTTRDVRKT